MSTATLYRFALCPFCNKVQAALELKGIPYETVEVTPRSKVELPPLPEGTPKKVPVLQMGEDIIQDSTAILKYLDELNLGERNLAGSDASKDQVVEIEDWIDENFITALPTVIYGKWSEAAKAAQVIAESSNFGPLQGIGVKVGGSVIMHMVAKRILKKHGQTDAHGWVNKNLDHFEELLGEGPYVCGDELTQADAAMHGAMTCVRDFPVFESFMARPNVAEWYGRVAEQRGAN